MPNPGTRFLTLATACFLWLLPAALQAQCVVINEIMINGPGGCDGSCNPNTEEWTELYNTCNTATNISCWMMTDGDFTVTFPTGTTIPAHGYLVIGSINSGGPVNIDLATCGCTSGSSIGTYTNAGEQVILVDASGTLQNGIYWGGGQFPVNITSAAVGACGPVTVNYPSSAGLENIGNDGGNGNTRARECDGSLTWVTRTGGAISLGSTNGQSTQPNFSSNDSSFCTGTCINFQDLSANGPTSWSWSFPGGTPSTSTSQNPSPICYNTPGNYNVTLTSTNACGPSTVTQNLFIHVANPPAPVVTPAGPLSFCAGGSALLQTGLNYTGYQWMQNGTNIAGANGNSFTAAASGSYSVQVDSNGCTGTSNAVSITVNPAPVATITPQGPTTLCSGGTVVLNAGAGFASYQWLLNGTPINGATNQTYTAGAAGNYQVVVSNAGNCTDTSANQPITVGGGAPPVIVSSTGSFVLCSGNSLLLSIPAGATTYQWYYNNNPMAGATNSSVTISNSGNYYVIETLAGGCSDTAATITITPSAASVQINSNAPSYCSGETAILTATGNFSNAQWSTGSNQNSINVGTSGLYIVQVSNANGCSARDSMQLQFASINLFSGGPDVTVICDFPAQLNATGADSYSWTPATGLSNPLIGNPTVTANASTQYIVTGSIGNCSASDTIEVIYGGCQGLFIPNAFSPNNDGTNDMFKPIVVGSIHDYLMRIYNRWGQMIFESSIPNIGWDGTYQGQRCEVGTYIWTINALDDQGATVPVNGGKPAGNVTLLR